MNMHTYFTYSIHISLLQSSQNHNFTNKIIISQTPLSKTKNLRFIIFRCQSQGKSSNCYLFIKLPKSVCNK